MIPWPETGHKQAIPEAEPVDTVRPEQPPASAGPAVALDTAPPTDDAAPALPAATPLALPRRSRAFSAGLALAFGLSAAMHAAVIAVLGNDISRPGVEAAIDAISVEIVLEEPSVAASAGAQAPAPAQELASTAATHADDALPRDMRPEEDMTASDAEPSEDPRPAEPTESDQPETDQPSRETDAEDGPQPPPELDRPAATSPEPPSGEGARPAETRDEVPVPEPPELAPSGPQEAPDAVASVVLPQENVPVPTPRPQPPQTRKKAERKPEPQHRQAQHSPPRTETTARQVEEAGRTTGNEGRAAASPAARQGGATAGEKAAYARRLVAHVERHKRYPAEAARAGMAGAAGLSIIIDRQGRLASARLSKGSGHAVLDREALAVARRAAPYPRPPEGLGGSTVSFSVTLRFSR